MVRNRSELPEISKVSGGFAQDVSQGKISRDGMITAEKNVKISVKVEVSSSKFSGEIRSPANSSNRVRGNLRDLPQENMRLRIRVENKPKVTSEVKKKGNLSGRILVMKLPENSCSKLLLTTGACGFGTMQRPDDAAVKCHIYWAVRIGNRDFSSGSGTPLEMPYNSKIST